MARRNRVDPQEAQKGLRLKERCPLHQDYFWYWNFPQKRNGLYCLGRNEIETVATKVLQELAPANLFYPSPLNSEKLLGDIGLSEEHCFLGKPGSNILGETVMGDSAYVEMYDGSTMQMCSSNKYFGTVLINATLLSRSQAGRRRYTEAHEASHWLLHQPYFRTQNQYSGSPKAVVCRTIERYNNTLCDDEDWLEWQADTLAASLLMPRQMFREYAKQVIKRAGATKGYLVEDNTSDRYIFYEAIKPIAKQFRVSQRAAQIRMVHLGLIKRGHGYQ